MIPTKYVLGILMLFVACATLAGIMDGTGGMYSTRLNGNLTNAATTITVDSNVGFLAADIIVIGSERIAYTGKNGTTEFTGATRGYNSTSAVAHSNNAMVYGQDSSVMNTILGFNITQVWGSGGFFGIVTVLGNFFTIALPKLVMWDFNFLSVGLMIYIKYILYCISGAFVIVMVLTLGSILASAASSLLNLLGRL